MTMNPEAPDRNLGLDLVRVTEAAKIRGGLLMRADRLSVHLSIKLKIE